MNIYMILFWSLFILCVGVFCYGYWSELGRNGRNAIKQLRRWWRKQQGHVLPVLALAFCMGLIVGYAWLHWIVTHDVK